MGGSLDRGRLPVEPIQFIRIIAQDVRLTSWSIGHCRYLHAAGHVYATAEYTAPGLRRVAEIAGYPYVMNDVRFALRRLGNGPAFTVTALATVAICLGANLAIFAVVDSILLRPLPFPESDRLVAIFNTYPKAGVERDGSSLTN